MFFNPILADDIGKLLLRLTLGTLILFHGVAKILHPAALDFISGKLAGYGLPIELAFAVYIGEVLAPLLVILGVFSRIGGLLIAINMAFAFVLVAGNQLMQINKFGGWQPEVEAFFLMCGLVVLFSGSGKFAIRPD